MKVSKIKVNGITNPVGYVMDNVRVSWLVSETEVLSIVETHILVAADPMFKNIAAQKSGAHLDPARGRG